VLLAITRVGSRVEGRRIEAALGDGNEDAVPSHVLVLQLRCKARGDSVANYATRCDLRSK